MTDSASWLPTYVSEQLGVIEWESENEGTWQRSSMGSRDGSE